MMSVMSPVQSIFAGLKSVPLPLPLSLSTCSPAQVVGKAPLVRYPPLRDPSFGLGSRCSLLFFCGGVIACHTIADDGRRWLLACLEGILAEKVRQSGTGGRNAFGLFSSSKRGQSEQNSPFPLSRRHVTGIGRFNSVVSLSPLSVEPQDKFHK